MRNGTGFNGRGRLRPSDAPGLAAFTNDDTDGDADIVSFGAPADEVHEEIGRLEAQLEALAEGLARCAKVKLVSKVALAGGAAWLLAAIAGLVSFDPAAMAAAIAAVIGGVVMYGSNATTAQELETATGDTEARRAALIGQLNLRVVGDE